MGTNKTIIIWIAVLALVGIILLMVACEKGVLHANDPLLVEEQDLTGKNNSNAAIKHEGLPQDAGEDGLEPAEETVESLTVGKPYSQKLTEEGSRNILIIGQDKLNNLYDTIGIASIDKSNKVVNLIMIPRDTYIEYNTEILEKLEAVKLRHEPGVYRINYTHHIGNLIEYNGSFEPGSISFLADVIEEKFNVKIDDYLKINTRGFKQLVDHLGGVEIYVPYNMDYDDPMQDLHIHIPKGTQTLDGYNAEGFVRFRQGYREDGTLLEIGDINRKKNQLNFLQQLIKQKGTLKNIDKLPGIIDILGKNLQHSIGFEDILKTYIGMAKDVITEKYEIKSINIDSEKMTRVDGASYIVIE